MVIERFTRGPEPVYARAAERGRMLPDGLAYLDSWVVDELRSRFDEWFSHWSDLGTIEVIPVITSAEASARMGRRPIG
jgi:hypothetical protein